MIKKIKNVFSSPDKKRLLENFLSLSVLQGANYILPLIILPYLIRVIGIENYGLIAFAQSFNLYFFILINYGFSLSATRKVAINRESNYKLNEIYSHVIIIKLLLFVFSFFLLLLLIFSIKKLQEYAIIIFLYFFSLIGTILSPLWLFQGLEKTKFVTISSLVSKTLYSSLIFLFIKEEKDFILVPIFYLITTLIEGIFSSYIVIKFLKIKFKKPNLRKIAFYLKDGWSIFKSEIAGSLYSNSNILILGLLTEKNIVGYYAVAEKLLKVILFIQIPIGQSLFPYLSNKFKNMDTKKAIYTLFKYQKYFFIFYFFLFIFSFLFAPLIVKILTGKYIDKIIIDFRILSFILILAGLNHYFGVLGLVSLGKYKEYSKSIIITGILSLPSIFTLSFLFKDIGASISFVISDIILFLLLLSKLLYFKNKQ